MEELRRRFDEYRDTHPELLRSGYPWPLPVPAAMRPAVRSIEDVTIEPEPEPESEPGAVDDDEDGVAVYRTGMTLRDLEEAAITAALREVKGNRRRAAEMLGMGERTLYRKIKEYEIPL
jgi:DNA-binding NtrC family response regulator